MQVLDVSIKVTKLRKQLVTKLARVRLLTTVNSEVLTEAARLLERPVTLFEQALEEVNLSAGQWVLNFESSVLIIWNVVEVLSPAHLLLQHRRSGAGVHWFHDLLIFVFDFINAFTRQIHPHNTFVQGLFEQILVDCI